ncbi:hypothetical protein DPMN_045369 [Dreissena polymorpha]|uniref:Uncharacterized protein n=1 Tax=Dreissena polymorpha TaxID=45954 RepID=A0A9D4HZN6_DREPO|nr:hypothetical protein DPMN_045369 [Dreissena polymorpha]
MYKKSLGNGSKPEELVPNVVHVRTTLQAASDLTLSIVKKFRLRIYLSAEFFQNMRERSVPYYSPFQKIFQSPLPYICIRK